MHEQPSRGFEDFHILSQVQQELERQGYFFCPVEKEHTEGLVTAPLLHRIRTHIKKRGFEKVAGHVAITFSGYAQDPREIFAIPEVRSYWQRLDRELPELPALLTLLPQFGFNGPGQHLELTGEIDEVREQPPFGYDVHIVDAADRIHDALRRIHQAGTKYHLAPPTVARLADQFIAGVQYRFPSSS